MLEEGSFMLIMLLFSTALGLSFLVERFLEFLNGLFKRLAFSDLGRFSTEASPATRERTEDLVGEDGEQSETYGPVLFAMDALQPRDSVETTQVFLLQVVGVVVGVVLCWIAKFGLFGPLNVFSGISGSLDWVLTGILIGGGSQPIHFLIQFLNQRKIVEAGPAEILPIVDSSGVIVDLSDNDPDTSFYKILDVPYNGGYKPESLENRNFRPAPPDLIVYHHTALHSNAAFADVVREIVEVKGWSTGYHSVIAGDGTINNFARWDRTGVHALGVNQRSLGIALNGNFHSDPGDPFSNDQGQFGNMRPTDIQLLSAAKVVALWCHLYQIPVKFGETIVSHREVRATACSGSNFPYGPFEALVQNCYDAWNTHEAQTELIFYKQKQLIYSD